MNPETEKNTALTENETKSTAPAPVQCACQDEQILIKGVCPRNKVATLLDRDDKTWTQISLPETVTIPEAKPDIEQLLSLTVFPEIISQRVIRTPALTIEHVNVPIQNQEGTFLTGRKLVVEGIMHQRFLYTANLPSQSVHSAHFDIPFSAFIILPGQTGLNEKFEIEACIEDIFVQRLTLRQIFKNITLFIKASPLGYPDETCEPQCKPKGGCKL